MNSKTTWLLVALAVASLAMLTLDNRRVHKLDERQARNHKLLVDFNPATVTKIEILWPTNRILRVVRQPSGWQITEPINYPAERLRIEGFLNALAALNRSFHLSAQDVMSEPHGLSAFGIDPPRITIILHQKNQRRELRIGNKTAVGDQLYLQLVGTDGVFFTDASFLKHLPHGADDWRSTLLLPIKPRSFNRLEVRAAPPNGFVVQRNPTNHLWSLMTQPVARADNPKLNQLISQLENWKITRFVNDNAKADLADYGLRHPKAELILGQGSNDLFVVQFGNSPTNHPSQVYARRLDQSNIVEVPKKLLQKLCVPYTEYRDHRLLSGPVSAIDQVVVKGSHPFTLTRQTNGLWRVKAKQRFQADPQLVRAFLGNLCGMRVKVEKDIVTDFADYGLAHPQREYLLQVGSKQVRGATHYRLLAHLEFGTTNKTGKIYTRRTDENSVYAAKLKDFRQLPSAAFELRDRQLWHFNPSWIQKVALCLRGHTNRLRRLNHKWRTAATNQPPLGAPQAAELNECLHRLSTLHVLHWQAQGSSSLPHYGFSPHSLAIVLTAQVNGSSATRRLAFGEWSDRQNIYASTQIDGRPFVFELPASLFYLIQDLSHQLAASGSKGPP